MPTGVYIRTKPNYRKGKKGYVNAGSFKKGHPAPKTAFKKGLIPWNKGLKGFMAGEKNSNWKGGITPWLRKIRNTPEYKEWRIKIFSRDNWTCQGCQKRGIYLEAHHIKNIASFPELVYELENGVTLCLDCHKIADKYRKKLSYVNRRTEA